MSSPFPGMDPYLETPDWFPDLHGSLIVVLKASLQLALPDSYYAQSSYRVWLEYTRRYVEPDVEVVKRTRRAGRGERGGIAVAERRAADPLVLTVETIEHGPFKESFLEIKRRKSKEIQLVTSIEVLSPANKTPGNPGRDKYLEKQPRGSGQPDSPGRDRPTARRYAHLGGSARARSIEGRSLRLPRVNSSLRQAPGIRVLSNSD